MVLKNFSLVSKEPKITWAKKQIISISEVRLECKLLRRQPSASSTLCNFLVCLFLMRTNTHLPLSLYNNKLHRLSLGQLKRQTRCTLISFTGGLRLGVIPQKNIIWDNIQEKLKRRRRVKLGLCASLLAPSSTTDWVRKAVKIPSHGKSPLRAGFVESCSLKGAEAVPPNSIIPFSRGNPTFMSKKNIILTQSFAVSGHVRHGRRLCLQKAEIKKSRQYCGHEAHRQYVTSAEKWTSGRGQKPHSRKSPLRGGFVESRPLTGQREYPQFCYSL